MCCSALADPSARHAACMGSFPARLVMPRTESRIMASTSSSYQRRTRSGLAQRLLRSVVIACPLLLLLGCSQGRPPFLILQTCLINAEGVSQFKQEMKSIATEEHMEYVDGSENTKRSLDAIGYAGRERQDGSPVIHVGVDGPDGIGFSATNVSLPGYQVALGFSEGSNSSQAHRFADVVTKRLEQRWQVEVLPAGAAAVPKPGCR
jgi:hypothetical protein